MSDRFCNVLYQSADWLTRWDSQINRDMIQPGKRRPFAMGRAIGVRTDYTSAEVRRFAKRAEKGRHNTKARPSNGFSHGAQHRSHNEELRNASYGLHSIGCLVSGHCTSSSSRS